MKKEAFKLSSKALRLLHGNTLSSSPTPHENTFILLTFLSFKAALNCQERTE
jgi:hypothetical protein